MDAAILVHMREGKTYEDWEELMLNAYDNRKEVEDGKIVYGKANDNTAIILRFDFDPAEMAKRLEDLEFMERVADVVESREMYSLSSMQRPEWPRDLLIFFKLLRGRACCKLTIYRLL